MMNKPTILLVDDEERILRSLRMMFLTSYNVLMTTDAHEAISILRKEKVHVIISDQRMPIMQGSELLRIACETSPATMRILLTGYSDLNASIASVNEGEVYRYLLKPWVGEEVKKVVAEAAAIAEATFMATLQQRNTPVHGRGKPRILIMDNDVATATTVCEIMGDRCEVIWASTVQKAMEELARQNVSVVVSDLMLGDTDISYILKTIKQLNPQTQSIVITDYKDTATLIDLINQAQITRYMPKPICKNLLTRYLESVLERFHILVNQPEMPTRQAVAPISNPNEMALASRFMGMLGRIRQQVGV
jgi:serine/threonine-protein kinase